ncbi:arsenate reductase family protein [Chitinophagaceae bacterium MMS25-I14]
MAKKIYHLSTCDTCRKILKEIDATANGFELQDIKTNPVTEEQLDAMKEKAGSYEALFSRRSQQYKALGLADKQLTEADYRRYILEHYTFLKRPVIIYKDQMFVGNEKKTIEALKEGLH